MNKLTPREPTPEMVEAGSEVEPMSDKQLRSIWRAMHDAAPTVDTAQSSHLS